MSLKKIMLALAMVIGTSSIALAHPSHPAGHGFVHDQLKGTSTTTTTTT